MSERAPERNKVQEELARIMFSNSGGALITIRDNLETYLAGRENPGQIKNIPYYAALDRIYREYTDLEISQLIQGLKK